MVEEEERKKRFFNKIVATAVDRRQFRQTQVSDRTAISEDGSLSTAVGIKTTDRVNQQTEQQYHKTRNLFTA